MAYEPRAKVRSDRVGRVSPYAFFVGGSFAWFLAAGIHQVILSWLLVGELDARASWVGTIQMLGLPA